MILVLHGRVVWQVTHTCTPWKTYYFNTFQVMVGKQAAIATYRSWIICLLLGDYMLLKARTAFHCSTQLCPCSGMPVNKLLYCVIDDADGVIVDAEWLLFFSETFARRTEALCVSLFCCVPLDHWIPHCNGCVSPWRYAWVILRCTAKIIHYCNVITLSSRCNMWQYFFVWFQM